jgi:DnaK suppressor protein
MDKKIIAEMQAKLEAEKIVLEKELAKLNQPIDMGDDIDSFDEEADEATEFSANAGMIQTLKSRYHSIQEALAKIVAGSFGVCEQCNKPIEVEILNINPESHLCKADKQKMNK